MAAADLSPAYVKMRYSVGDVFTMPIIKYSLTAYRFLVLNLTSYARTVLQLLWQRLYLRGRLLLRRFFTTSDIQSGELWYKPTPTSDPLFIYGVSIAVVGTSTTATRVSGQYTQTLRSAGGSHMKITLMEPSISATDSVDNYPYTVGINKTISDWLLSNANWIKAKDDTWPITGMRTLLKTNDALRKKQLSI